MKGHFKFKVHKRYMSETKETLHFGMIIGLSTVTPPATSPCLGIQGYEVRVLLAPAPSVIILFTRSS